jgi:hypothetical protein
MLVGISVGEFVSVGEPVGESVGAAVGAAVTVMPLACNAHAASTSFLKHMESISLDELALPQLLQSSDELI